MKTTVQISVGFSLACVLLVLACMSLPVQATAGSLPPRPTLSPNPSPAPPPSKDQEGSSIGGSIELHVPTNQIALWTVVQWQDTIGGWHTVQGWQGTLDEINATGLGKKVWRVGQNEMGQKSFRWLVYESAGGRMLATSQSFDLPCCSGEVVQVEITLPD
jgi:hypothetical protein